MNSLRYSIAVGVGFAAWMVWFVGGWWVAFEVHDAYGTLPAILIIVAVLAVAVAAPVWLFTRGMDQ